MEIEPKEQAHENAEPDLVHVFSEPQLRIFKLAIWWPWFLEPGPHKPRKRLIWKKYYMNGACRKCDIYVRFKTKKLLITTTILKTALKKLFRLV
jgi:hypothetical protein